MTTENPADETLFRKEMNDDEPEAEIINISEEDLNHGDELIASALAAFEHPDFKLEEDDSTSPAVMTDPSRKPGELATEVEPPAEQTRTDQPESPETQTSEKPAGPTAEEREAEIEKRYKSRLSKAGKKIKTLQLKVETLEKQLKEAVAAAEDFKGRWVRVSADYQNYQKRSRNKLNEFVELERMNLIRDFLPVVENLKRAVEHMESDNDVRQGLMMINRQVQEMLTRWNIREIPAKGEPFDPYCHDAIDRIESREHPPNTILEVISPGYYVGDKVLKPTKVIVSYRTSENETVAPVDQHTEDQEKIDDLSVSSGSDEINDPEHMKGGNLQDRESLDGGDPDESVKPLENPKKTSDDIETEETDEV